jgi:hypothetical protein
MFGELESDHSERLAAELVQQMRTTYAASAMIAVNVDGRDYQVMVVPKDMQLERKTALLKPIQWKQYEAID